VTMECYDEECRYDGQDGSGSRRVAKVMRYRWDEIERQLRAFESREKVQRRRMAVLGIIAALAIAWAGLLLGER